ncbi:MAG TPA: GtrA family protein [Bryobacteraceae bacterium]|nr:GtrA family protein [Bryobacteraceae bacterium]
MSGARQFCGRFGRFNLVGLVGAALQVLLLDLLMKRWRLPNVMATPIAVEIALLHNFLWHERFTWRDREPTGLRQRGIRLWKFHAGNGLISLAGNTALTYCFVEKLKAPAVPSALAAIALCAPANFLLSNHWIFKSQ